MTAQVLGRESEMADIGRAFDRARVEPGFLCLSGEAGIGKTALLEWARGHAASRGYLVLRTSPSSAEARMSYAGLADLLEPLSPAMDVLPTPQRTALDAALLREPGGGRDADMRTVAAATLSLLTQACRHSPVLIAVDDAQWLDDPTARALTFALRRCSEQFVMLSTLRSGFEFPFGELESVGRASASMSLPGLSTPSLQELVRLRLGKSLSRADLQRIARVSGGNPLFALELARNLDEETASPLETTVISRMRARLMTLPRPARRALLLASAADRPTAAVMESLRLGPIAEVLAPAERQEIVSWHGSVLGFSHPMWREVIYESAAPAARRAAHQRLSAVTDDLEERARHLALSDVMLSRSTLAALQAGADLARSRGAPSASAELIELALDRGATDPQLRLQAANDHFQAGSLDRAFSLASGLAASESPGRVRAAALALMAAVSYLNEDFPSAIASLEGAFAEKDVDDQTAAGLAVDLSFALVNLGAVQAGAAWADRAEARAAASGSSAVAAEAAAAVAVHRFLAGHGIDEERLERALRDEDPGPASPTERWPSMNAGLLRLWSFDLDRAWPLIAEVRRRFDERGLESGLWLFLGRLVDAALWRGDIVVARAAVSELAARAAIGDDPAISAIASASRVVLAAWCGEPLGARSAFEDLQALTSAGAHPLPQLAGAAAMGMSELTEGDAAAAAALLQPAAGVVLASGIAEPVITPFFPDMIDASVATGQPELALALVELLESWGARSGSAWPSGVAARGRALLALHDNDLDAADRSLERAAAHLDTGSLRYEAARTHLVSSAVHRRRRRRALARDQLRLARRLFTDAGALGWASHATRELERLGLDRVAEPGLTASERRAADLAASGLTNAAVAARMGVSPKTVEAHLSRVYAKLGIRSRAELGQWRARGGGRSP